MSVAEHIANWSFLVMVALLADLLFGGRRLLGRVPGPDQMLYSLVARVAERLDRAARSEATRAARGLLLLLLFVPPLAGLGHLVDRVAFDGRTGSFLAVLLLTLLLGQRQVWDLVRAIRKALTDDRARVDEKRFGAARWALERLTLRLSDGLVVNVILLLAGGFTLLLPFRLIAVTVATGSPAGLLRPRGAFQRSAVLLHEIGSAPGAFLAGLLVAIAQFFAPRGSGRALRGLVPPKGPYLLARVLPMGALAHGLGLNFKSDADARDEVALWFGPKDGRARLGPADISRALMVAVVATLLVFLLLLGLMMGGGLYAGL